MTVKDFMLKLVRVTKESEDVKTFRFEPDKPVEFHTGQYIMLSGEINGEKVTRCYSVSSSPSHQDYVEITFKVYPDGKFSPFLWNMKEGDTIQGKGPMGFFCFDKCDVKDMVFIAGGTGIAAFTGMVRYATEKGLDVKMMLIYSARNPEEIVFRDELFGIEKKNPKFRFVVTITRPWTSKTKWEGRTGRIDAEFLKETISDPENKTFYLCGPPKMVESTKEMLKEIGVKEDKVKAERWG
ncbi:MAG: hypothetical protein JW754_04725 [Candidatus Aenigmarchaeota archaeon]|nr:hypothetical protein [Candidatus Aenigmarchaeota archaeon]